MTPGAPSPGGYNPHTPGSNIDQTSCDWVTTDILVRVKDTFLDAAVVSQTGVIRSVTVSCSLLDILFLAVPYCGVTGANVVMVQQPRALLH